MRRPACALLYRRWVYVCTKDTSAARHRIQMRKMKVCARTLSQASLWKCPAEGPRPGQEKPLGSLFFSGLGLTVQLKGRDAAAKLLARYSSWLLSLGILRLRTRPRQSIQLIPCHFPCAAPHTSARTAAAASSFVRNRASGRGHRRVVIRALREARRLGGLSSSFSPQLWKQCAPQSAASCLERQTSALGLSTIEA